MGTLSASGFKANSDGSYGRIDCNVAFGSSYNNTGSDATTGETITAKSVGLSTILGIEFPSEEAGYGFQVLGLTGGPVTSARVKVFQGGAGTTGATSGGTPAGSVTAPTLTMDSYTPEGTNGTSAVTGTGTFTGTASTTGEVTAFSGTGQASAGQVITTTDNQTMALNECAGMWFISATHGPYYIVSNTAVSGAPAVLTVIGDAPTTDAGAYQIVKSPTPVGTVSALSGTAAAQTFTGTPATLTGTNSVPTFTGSALATHTHPFGAGAGGEVPNGTNLSVSLASVRVSVYGY